MFKGIRNLFQRRLQDDEEAASRAISAKVAELDELLTHIEGLPGTHARLKLVECASWAHVGLLNSTGRPRTEVGVPPLPK